MRVPSQIFRNDGSYPAIVPSSQAQVHRGSGGGGGGGHHANAPSAAASGQRRIFGTDSATPRAAGTNGTNGSSGGGGGGAGGGGGSGGSGATSAPPAAAASEAAPSPSSKGEKSGHGGSGGGGGACTCSTSKSSASRAAASDGVAGAGGSGAVKQEGGGGGGGGGGGVGRKLLAADQRDGTDLLNDAVSLLTGFNRAGKAEGNGHAPNGHDGGAPAANGDDDAGADAEEEDDDDGGENGGGDGDGGVDGAAGVSDDAVRSAVKVAMGTGGLTQYSVAVSAGVSQPVLCTYLGGKASKANGKNSKVAVRAKLLAWLGKRGVSVDGVVAAAASNGDAADGAAPPASASPAPPAAAAPPPQSAPSGRKRGKEADGGADTPKGGGSAGGAGASTSSSKASGKKGASSKGDKIKITPHHLYVAYIWYLKQRDAEGLGVRPGEEESFCLKCKDGGDMLYCDFGGCTKCYHVKCCGLKSVPEGIWECPRHRCIKCGAGPSQTDAHGKPRKPDADAASTLWPCRTCPTTYCERCLPEEVSFVKDEIVCESCQGILAGASMEALQRDLMRWKPEMFALNQ